MRILLASETYPPDANGAAYFTRRLAEGLTEAGHDVHVGCPAGPGGELYERRDEALIHRAPSMQIPTYPHLRFSPRPRSWARDTIRILKPDLVHIQNHFFVGRAIATAASRAGVPVIATNHFVPENFTVHAEYLPRAARAVLVRALWSDLGRVYRQATAITTPTPYAAGLLREHGIVSSAIAISCGVDLERFRVLPPGREALAMYGIGDRPTCLVVGRLDRDKRIDEVIRALALTPRGLGIQLVVVGRGKELERLQRVAEAEGVAESVAFTGFVDDPELPGIYGAADVYVNAGIAELQSISTLEAMACGKPVIASSAMALPQLVREGVNGYTFEPGDVPELASFLCDLFRQPALRERMGAESRALASAHTARATVEQYEALYEEVLAAHPQQSRARVTNRKSAGVTSGAVMEVVASLSASGEDIRERDPAEALEALLRWRAALLSGLFSLMAAGAIALVPIDSDYRPSLSWEWGLYVALVPVAALMAIWLMRRSLDGLRAGWAAFAGSEGPTHRAR